MREWTKQSLLNFSSGYWEVCALHAAIMTDLFTPLAGSPMNEIELAAKCRLSLRGAYALATAACAMGLLVRQNGKLALTDFSRAHLVSTSPEYLGNIIQHHHHLMAGWMRLDEAAKSGMPTGRRNKDDPVRLAAFLKGMANMAIERSREVADQLDLSKCKRLLDLGGGPGSYAAAFCEKNPGLEAVIFDRNSTRPFAMETIKARGLDDRISFVGGNIVEDTLPIGFDAVWISHVLHGTGYDNATIMCRQATACLNPGGAVYIQEFYLNNTLDGPVFPAMFNCNMLQGTEDGKAYTWNEVETLLREAGCYKVERLSIGSNPSIGILRGQIFG